MTKISQTHHVREKGAGKGKLRKNPKRGKIGELHAHRNINKTMFLQSPVTGKMEGRETVRGVGDGTGIFREEAEGRILGRTNSPLENYTPTMNKVRFGKKK